MKKKLLHCSWLSSLSSLWRDALRGMRTKSMICIIKYPKCSKKSILEKTIKISEQIKEITKSLCDLNHEIAALKAQND